MDNPNLFYVAPKFVGQAWRDGAHQLSIACEKAAGEVTGDQLKLMLSRGEHQLFGFRDGDGPALGWIAVSIQQMPNLRALFIYAIHAPGAAGVECMSQLKAYAQSEGCTVIRGACDDAVLRLWQIKFKARKVYTIAEVEV